MRPQVYERQQVGAFIDSIDEQEIATNVELSGSGPFATGQLMVQIFRRNDVIAKHQGHDVRHSVHITATGPVIALP